MAALSAAPDGSLWNALGQGMDGVVKALTPFGTTLAAGGQFTHAQDVVANRVAQWDGLNWQALGTGMDNDVHALAVLGTDLVAGGAFASADGSPASFIARWTTLRRAGTILAGG